MTVRALRLVDDAVADLLRERLDIPLEIAEESDAVPAPVVPERIRLLEVARHLRHDLRAAGAVVGIVAEGTARLHEHASRPAVAEELELHRRDGVVERRERADGRALAILGVRLDLVGRGLARHAQELAGRDAVREDHGAARTVDRGVGDVAHAALRHRVEHDHRHRGADVVLARAEEPDVLELHEAEARIGLQLARVAPAEAVDGDVITLSSGAFNVSPITKSITVYGAGFEKDENSNTNVSKINGQLNLGVSGGETLANIHLEGISFNAAVNTNVPLEGFVMEKCYVNGNVNVGANSNTMIRNSVITGAITGGDQIADNCIIQNCYVGGAINTFNVSSSVKIDHCIACDLVGPYYCSNSIFPYYWVGAYYDRAAFANTEGAVVHNCIFRSFNYNNQDKNDFQNCYAVDIKNIFSDAQNATYSATRTFEIQQPGTWVGTDGQEIGIRYGWSKVPKTPVVTNLTTTVSGERLEVDYDAIVR